MRAGAYMTLEAALVLPEVLLIIIFVINMWLAKTDFCLESQDKYIAEVSAGEESLVDKELILRLARLTGDKDGES